MVADPAYGFFGYITELILHGLQQWDQCVPFYLRKTLQNPVDTFGFRWHKIESGSTYYALKYKLFHRTLKDIDYVCYLKNSNQFEQIINYIS